MAPGYLTTMPDGTTRIYAARPQYRDEEETTLREEQSPRREDDSNNKERDQGGEDEGENGEEEDGPPAPVGFWDPRLAHVRKEAMSKWLLTTVVLMMFILSVLAICKKYHPTFNSN